MKAFEGIELGGVTNLSAGLDAAISLFNLTYARKYVWWCGGRGVGLVERFLEDGGGGDWRFFGVVEKEGLRIFRGGGWKFLGGGEGVGEFWGGGGRG